MTEQGHYSLRFRSSAGEHRIAIGQGLLIGRSPEADVVLLDAHVSSWHARVSVCDGALCLEDLGSRTGTRLNSKTLTPHDRAVIASPTRTLAQVGGFVLGFVEARVQDETPPGSRRGDQYFLEAQYGTRSGSDFFELAAFGYTTIGRAMTQRVYIDDGAISREHASILSNEQGLFFKVFGSNNTLLNGALLERSQWYVIKHGDLITSSSVSLRVIFGFSLTPSSPIPASIPYMPAVPAQPTIHGHNICYNKIQAHSTMAQALASVLTERSSSGSFDITLADNTTLGKIEVKVGEVTAAAIITDGISMQLPMRKAFLRMTQWTDGSYFFSAAGDQPLPNLLNHSLAYEALQQVDRARYLQRVISPNDHLRLKVPILPPLGNLEPKLKDTLQMVINCHQVSQILDQSDADDIDILADLAHLLQREYIQQLSTTRASSSNLRRADFPIDQETVDPSRLKELKAHADARALGGDARTKRAT